ncbi:hypothetical protein J7T55_005598 [Diaporthe amygdali]|uniref:uncharacterized protein n=1 Tax=Phomopsis amygdali TaxID=1214568 RepID=UPI0022FEC893|nr:uncharacterized protein J7T55_005598 [Diaporthe amygdali]KAJ0124260.1 hypothetical protein J7T55_005598 [Diaporthe amygdali]
MTADRVAYDVLQTAMARQRVTVYDLYGLLGVSPNADEEGLRAAYDSITKKLQQVPSDAVSVRTSRSTFQQRNETLLTTPLQVNAAYSILANPFKRAQYDRDRLEYLYRHFSTHDAFPPTASIPSSGIKSRDDQIQVYASTLVDRVKDPIEDKKKAVNRRLETIRNELDEFNEISGKQRQDWATSNNRVLRMAGNALCEVVVCAEEDLRMLEDELGRIDGTLAPKDLDGPAGRVTSVGYYGSEIMAMPTGTTSTIAPEMQPRVLMGKHVPSLPHSPTVRFLPQSASKLGIDGPTKDTPSSDGSQDADGKHRVNDFLLGPAHARMQPSNGAEANKPSNKALHVAQMLRRRESTLLEKLRHATATEHFDANMSSVGTGMGLVDWQRLNRPSFPDEVTKSKDTSTDLTAWNKAYDPKHTQSADELPTRPTPHRDAPTPPSGAGRNSWDPAFSRGRGVAADGNFGFHVAQPAARGHSLTASNTVLFKEVQDRAAALARAPGRWVVGGPGLTNYDAGRVSSGEKKENRPEDPFA